MRCLMHGWQCGAHPSCVARPEKFSSQALAPQSQSTVRIYSIVTFPLRIALPDSEMSSSDAVGSSEVSFHFYHDKMNV